MDANGTGFHLLLGEADWSGCVTPAGEPVRAAPAGSPPGRPPFAWDERTSELTLQPEAFLFTQQTAPQRPVQPDADRRGVGADRFGNIYWIDESAVEIKVLSAGSGGVSHFWAAGDGVQCAVAPGGEFAAAQALAPVAPLRLAGLAVTSDHYLVVGVSEPRGLLIFDLYVSGPPQQWLWPSTVEFAPFDIAARPQGGMWILDRRQHRVWELDRLFNVVPHTPPTATISPVGDFESAYPEAEPPHPPSAPRTLLTADAALALPDCNPVAIEALPDDSFLILAQPAGTAFATVERYRFDSGSLGVASTDVLGSRLSPGDPFALVAHDFIAVPFTTGASSVAATLYVAGVDGNQCFSFDLMVAEVEPRLRLEASAAYWPMRLFEGKGLVTVQGEPYYDFGSGWVPLKEQKRPRYPEQATLVTRVFDAREPQCTWHRLLIDAVIPPHCQVQVWSRAADDATALADPDDGEPWSPEPPLYRRGDGSEIAYAEPPTRSNEGTWELLFQKALGRYAQLKLVITGDQRSTPRLRALRIYYPRFSYLARYLPAAYREDATSASFLDRFLANFEGSFTAIEDRIAAVQVLFDVRSVPSAALPWVADWFGVVLDPAWDDGRRRLFIRNAMVFFQWRGTALGLKIALRLALDDCASDAIFDLDAARDEQRYGIRIAEGFQSRGHGGRWAPADGEIVLNRGYGAAIGSSDSTTRYPLIDPADDNEDAWRAFSSRMFGFVPAASEEQMRWQQFLCTNYSDVETLNAAYGTDVTDIDQLPMPQDLPPDGAPRTDWDLFQSQGTRLGTSLISQWHGYLARRYTTVQSMNGAYGTAWRKFDEVAYPVVIPHGDTALKDWFDFESTTLAMQRAAHRFRVLLPLFAQDSDDRQREQRRALAQRIIELEKPAHTVFEVNYYWAMFLVGTARIGHDTQLDAGSRAPQLAVAAILNRAYLGNSYLATDFPPPGARRVLGVGALDQGAGTGRFHS